MELSEFIEATSRVENYYGKEYTTEQRRIMHEELKNLTIERYRQLISAVMRKSKFLPKIADFMEANIEEPYSSNKEEKQKIECEKCKGTGYLIYTKVIPDGDHSIKNTYAAVCPCGNAKQYKGWEITDKRHRSEFYTPMAEEIGVSNE